MVELTIEESKQLNEIIVRAIADVGSDAERSVEKLYPVVAKQLDEMFVGKRIIAFWQPERLRAAIAMKLEEFHAGCV